jgi:hypothetical protein
MEIKGLSDLNETLMSRMIKKYICNKSYSHILRYHVLIVFMKKSYTKVYHKVNHMNRLTNLIWCYILKKKGTFWFLWYKCMMEEEEKKWKIFSQHKTDCTMISVQKKHVQKPQHVLIHILNTILNIILNIISLLFLETLYMHFMNIPLLMYNS